MCTYRRVSMLAFAAVLTISTAGTVSAQQISAPDQASVQLGKKVASTFIVRFDADVDPSLYRRRAASIASRFRGQVIHTYENVFPGFAIRVGDAGAGGLMAAAGQLGIASVSPDVMVSISAGVGNGPGAAKGRPSFLSPPPPEPTGAETLGWNISRVTGLTQGDCGSAVCGAGSGLTFPSIKVCVIDTGIAAHEDLNLGAGTSIIGSSSEDDNGHGTHVAGIIGAKANGLGVVGVAPGVTVVPVKVLDAGGSGALSDVVDGIDWAAESGNCTIANLSLGAATGVTVMDDAVACASGVTPTGYPSTCSNNNLLVTIAAGNDKVDIITGKGKGYTPARASTGRDDKIFTIASIANNDAWSSYSNFQSDGSAAGRVDFALPGQSILSSWNDGGYKNISGTSMAAPHMAGLLARKLAKYGPDTGLGDGDFCPQQGCGTVVHSSKGSSEVYDIIQVDY